MNELEAQISKFNYLEKNRKNPLFVSRASEIELVLIDIKNEVLPFVLRAFIDRIYFPFSEAPCLDHERHFSAVHV